MNIGIANDHRGFNLKQKITNYLTKKGYTIINYGTDSNESVDYPDFAFKLGEAINNGEIEIGIAICGRGIGISIACNKVKNIRCAKVDNVEEARLTRSDNDANVIAINSTYPFYKVKDILDIFLKTPFSNEERHVRRVEKINSYTNRRRKNAS